jgi:hypothetical protein
VKRADSGMGRGFEEGLKRGLAQVKWSRWAEDGLD